jgi:hypothetical protein
LDAVQVFEEGFEAPDDEGEQGQDPKLDGDVGDAEAGQEGVFLGDDDVDGHADEDGRGEIEDLV